MSDTADTSISAAAEAFSKLPPMDEADPADASIDTEEDPIDDDQVEQDIDIEAQSNDSASEDGDEPSDTDEQEPEPDDPAIDAPASWDAEAKKVFATLPPDAQRVIAERESHREKAINAKASEAAQARKQSEGLVAEYTNLHRQFAEQLDTYAQAFTPQRPDYSLLATDPQAYAHQMAMYEAATAQRDDLMQRAAQARQQAEQIEKAQLESFQREEGARIVQAIPDFSDPAKAQKLWGDYSATAKALGYDDDLINQARAVDVIGLKTATEWRTKAEKWDALQASKMAAVRDAKGKPRVATPGVAQPKGSARAQGLQDSMSRLRKSGSLDDAAAAFRNIR